MIAEAEFATPSVAVVLKGFELTSKVLSRSLPKIDAAGPLAGSVMMPVVPVKSND